MKRFIIITLSVFVFAVSLFQSPAVADDNTFRFVVMGDSRPILATIDQSPPFKRILWETDLIGPEFAVHVGDLVFGYMSHEDELQRQYADLKKTLDPVMTPMHYAIGNHEIGSNGGLKEYEENVGKLYYSFDHGKSHFIIINSDYGESGDSGILGDEQEAWLKQDLLDHRNSKNVFAFMHKPMFYASVDGGSSWEDMEQRDRVNQMFLDNANVRAVFSGHAHIYRTFERDGIKHYITGGAGAESSNPDHEGFYHYLLVEMDGTSMEVKVVEPYRMWYQCEPECDGVNTDVKVTMITTLYSLLPTWIKGIMIKMPSLPDGKTYKASGGQIRAHKDNGDGTMTLKLAVNMNSPVGYKFVNIELADEPKTLKLN